MPVTSNISNANASFIPNDFCFQLNKQNNVQNNQNNVLGLKVPAWVNHIPFGSGNGNIDLGNQKITYNLKNNTTISAQIKPSDQKIEVCFQATPSMPKLSLEHTNDRYTLAFSCNV